MFLIVKERGIVNIRNDKSNVRIKETEKRIPAILGFFMPCGATG
jgi:hypothetical protein